MRIKLAKCSDHTAPPSDHYSEFELQPCNVLISNFRKIFKTIFVA